MIKKIKVYQLRPGIFIHDLNCSWLHHPFLVNRLKVEDDAMMHKIVQHGIDELYIDTEKGLDVDDAPAKKEVDQEIQTELNKLSGSKFKKGNHIPLKEEIVSAEQIIGVAKKTMQSLMGDVKLGKQI